ncbi:MAG: fused MFS/spermidine synthase [Akkermansiaceae bacterium]
MSKKQKARKQSAEVVERPEHTSGGLIAGMVLLSGVAGLVYQVLWMKQLSLLFGNTAHAASATLAVFFLGLGAGSWWWGRKVGSNSNPLRLYAWLEWGIAVSALCFFLFLWCFEAIYPSLYGALGRSGWMLVVKLFLALFLVFPAAFFMGGTVPTIGQVMVRERERFGRTAAWLYGLNTLGAAIGVWAAAFWLMPNAGFNLTYVITVAISVGVAGMAWKCSKHEPPSNLAEDTKGEHAEDDAGASPPSPSTRIAVVGLCFFSGFVVLSLEVLWTRIFAQVHENSVYAFAVVLTVVLIGLAIGAGISSLVSRFVRNPMLALGAMAVVGGCLLLAGPSLMMLVTKDLEPFHTNEPWDQHVNRLFKMVVGGIGYIVIALGTVFPFLMKVAERGIKIPGRLLGRLLAINTGGAILGSLLCGFVLLPHLGMWGTMKWLTAAYLVMALLVPSGWSKAAIICRTAGVTALILLFTVLDPSGLPVMGFPEGRKPGKILELWEESDCTVAVLEKQGGNRAIHVNSGYSLGSTAAYLEQFDQSRIPLHLFPKTESICFIGMGTGISAGAALDFRFPSVQRVVTCELSPSVVEAAQKWIPEHLLGGLFEDERSTVLVEDGRHHLMATRETFDMINADLFLPYRRGAGSLYSLDHYQVVAERLNPGGVFVQWLPLYQLTEYEFCVIANTMTQVFGEVTMWRNNFVPGQEKVALIGRLKSEPLPVRERVGTEEMGTKFDDLKWFQATPELIRVDGDVMPFLYAGNISQAAELFKSYPINTDDRPVIEYETPKRFREVAEEDKVIWCVGPKLTGWIARILEASPIQDDPLWRHHPESTKHLIQAGQAFHQSLVEKALNQRQEANDEWEIFLKNWRAAANE